MAVVALEEPPPSGTLIVMVSWLAASVRVGAAETLDKLSVSPATARSAKTDSPAPRKLSLRLVRRKPKCQIRRLVTIKLNAIATVTIVDEPVLANPATASPIWTLMVCVKVCVSMLFLPLIYLYCAYGSTSRIVSQENVSMITISS